MRQLVHKAIGIFFWIVLLVLWYSLVVEGRAGADNVTYWMLMLGITVIATPGALLGRRGRTSHWRTERVAVEEEAVALA